MALDNTNLLVRYYVDEAASGNTPTELIDTSGNGTPVNLTITYAAGNVAYTEVDGNRGLNQTDTTGNGGAVSAILSSGNKVYDALHGSKVCTLEYVCDWEEFQQHGGRQFGLMPNDHDLGTFIMAGDEPDGTVNNAASVRLNDVLDYTNLSIGNITGRAVIHVVLDTDEGTEANRIRVYINKTQNNVAGGASSLTAATTISFRSTRIVAMNRGDFNRACQGTFFYGAIYDTAFTQSRVDAHYDVLWANDDTPNPIYYRRHIGFSYG